MLGAQRRDEFSPAVQGREMRIGGVFRGVSDD
jgi:hypothetical protein